MHAFTNTQDYKNSQLIFRLKEKVVNGLRRGKPGQKRAVWEIEYLDGSKVIMVQFDYRLLAAGGVDLAAWPEYCGPCCAVKEHDFYHYNKTIKCRECGNKVGENDNRPVAAVFQLRSPKSEA